MRKTIIFCIISLLVYNCTLKTQENSDEIVEHFNSLTITAQVEYFNSLNHKDRFSILKDYLVGKCFELPIADVIKFHLDGNVLVDWMVDDPNGKGLIYASGEKESLIVYKPFNWKFNDKSLVISKTNQYVKFESVRSEGDRIFNMGGGNEKIVFENVFVEIFQNKLYFTLKNNQQEVSFFEGSCEKWPVMIEDLYE